MEGRANRYFKSEPLYPFGYGLSYSKFAYSNLKMLEALVEARQPLDASVTLTTEGQLVGDEVVVLYLNLPRRSGNPRSRTPRVSASPPGVGLHQELIA